MSTIRGLPYSLNNIMMLVSKILLLIGEYTYLII